MPVYYIKLVIIPMAIQPKQTNKRINPNPSPSFQLHFPIKISAHDEGSEVKQYTLH